MMAPPSASAATAVAALSAGVSTVGRLPMGLIFSRLAEAIDGRFLTVLDSADDLVVRRFTLEHLADEEAIEAFKRELRERYAMNEPGSDLTLIDSAQTASRAAGARLSRPLLSGQRISCEPLDPAQRKAGPHRGDTWQPRQTITVDVVVLVEIGRRHAQQIVRAARHEVAFQNIAEIAHSALEPVHRLAALAGERDLDKDLDRKADPARIDACRHSR